MITMRYAIRNVFRHALRSLVTLASISIGCAALIFAGGFFEDMFAKLHQVQINTQTGHIQIFRKGFSENGGANQNDFLIENPQRVADLIAAVPGVAMVAPRLTFSGLLSTGESTVPFIGIGLDPAKEPAIKAVNRRTIMKGVRLIEGTPLDPQSKEGVLLGKGLADIFEFHPGHKAVLLTRTIGGSLNGQDTRIAGIFVTGMKEVDDYALQIPLQAAQELLRTDGVQSLLVKIDDTSKTLQIKTQLLELFRKENLDLELKTWDELSDFSAKAKVLFGRFYFVLKLIIVFIVAFSIYNTLNMSIAERTAEIGTLRAMGLNRRSVIQLFLVEGSLLGVIGGALGIAVGSLLTFSTAVVGISMPASPGVSTPWLSEPKIMLGNLLFAFSLSVVCALGSAFFPAFRASRMEIAQALRTSN